MSADGDADPPANADEAGDQDDVSAAEEAAESGQAVTAVGCPDDGDGGSPTSREPAGSVESAQENDDGCGAVPGAYESSGGSAEAKPDDVVEGLPGGRPRSRDSKFDSDSDSDEDWEDEGEESESEEEEEEQEGEAAAAVPQSAPKPAFVVGEKDDFSDADSDVPVDLDPTLLEDSDEEGAEAEPGLPGPAVDVLRGEGDAGPEAVLAAWQGLLSAMRGSLRARREFLKDGGLLRRLRPLLEPQPTPPEAQ
eukprot:EG_transcript_26038